MLEFGKCLGRMRASLTDGQRDVDPGTSESGSARAHAPGQATWGLRAEAPRPVSGTANSIGLASTGSMTRVAQPSPESGRVDGDGQGPSGV